MSHILRGLVLEVPYRQQPPLVNAPIAVGDHGDDGTPIIAHHGAMTNSDRVPHATPQRSTGRLFAILAVFALAGPPIGSLVVSTSLAVLAATAQLTAGKWSDAGTTFLVGSLFGTIFGLPIAYAVGILPAAGVGLAVALWDRRKGLLSWRIAISAALVPWLFIAMRAGDLVEADEGTRIW